MSVFAGRCCFCGEVVPLRAAAYKVSGWELQRSGGGANRILGRKRVPETIAHADCAHRAVRREQQGISTEQESLL